MTTQTELLREALERILDGAKSQMPFSGMSWTQVEEICRAALAQPEQPAQQGCGNCSKGGWCGRRDCDNIILPQAEQANVETTEAHGELTGCACRWDKDDKRVQTCERHQGWLDVVHEWVERAKSAEQAEAAKPETVGINGLTEAETSATASVMGLAKPETERAELINLIVRDMGETDPADPQSHDTYWISESAMRAILENRLEEAALLSADSKDAGEPVAYGSRDELDNMLHDRSATVVGRSDGQHQVPLWDRPQAFGSSNAEIEQALAHDLEHLNCPHCRGSGHIDDAENKATKQQGVHPTILCMIADMNGEIEG